MVGLYKCNGYLKIKKPSTWWSHFPYQNYLARFDGSNLSLAAPQMRVQY